MSQAEADNAAGGVDPGYERTTARRVSGIIGTVGVVLALLSALFTFVVLAGMTPILPTHGVVVWLLLGNLFLVLVLVCVVAWEAIAMRRARREGAAGARLQGQIVRWFSVIAALPAVLVAVVASVTLERGLNPWFTTAIRDVLTGSVEIARAYSEAQCRGMTRETSLIATDLNRIKPAFDSDRKFFHDYLSSRAFSLGFPVSMIVKQDLTVVERVEFRSIDGLLPPTADDIKAVEDGEPWCLIPKSGNLFRVIFKLSAYPDMYLYTARAVDPRAIEFPPIAQTGLEFYRTLEIRKTGIQVAFATMFALIALIVLLSAVWLGLAFAMRLVAPVRRLIHAADQVATGNYYVQVPVKLGEGDLAHLGETFNKMTAELRRQHDRLTAASDLIDRRRRFTEAVLSGVSAGVIGLDELGRITVLNPSAEGLVSSDRGTMLGKTVREAIPEIAPLVEQAQNERLRLVQGQVTLSRGGRERQLNVRVTSEQAVEGDKGFVVTLDDITELVSAQRTSAWADVARRIAHEIKNPLTPIQLSAERIRRKYGKVITEDRAVFDQCTETIVRQVDDIKRMVDEFASFARMPKPAVASDDLVETVRQVVFLQRVGNPEITYEESLPDKPVIARFDRRLIGQALTNLVKNAGEAVMAVPEAERGPGRIWITAALDAERGIFTVDVTDNGKGFPQENRHRLLEPYMTTREGGTGLGLAIVGKILEDHHGGIELLDNPSGRGARVHIWLPLNPQKDADDAKGKAEAMAMETRA